jgi:hypothetical protein
MRHSAAARASDSRIYWETSRTRDVKKPEGRAFC